MAFLLLLFLASILATTSSSSSQSDVVHHQIHLLRPQSGAGGNPVPGLSCLSWRLGVETNNIVGWKTIPKKCEGYVGHYMLGEQYRKDSKAVANEAFLYAQSLKLRKDGKNVWIFDIDETTLSNLPYYADHGFGYVTKAFQSLVYRFCLAQNHNKYSTIYKVFMEIQKYHFLYQPVSFSIGSWLTFENYPFLGLFFVPIS